MNASQYEEASPALTGARLLHTMLRVADLGRSLRFYTSTLGMTLLRREDYPEGRFSLAFVGFGPEATHAVLELTHNWDAQRYEIGTAYGHVALEVPSLHTACAKLRQAGARFTRAPGPMRHAPADGSDPDVIAFIEDPDGYRIELIQARQRRPDGHPPVS